MNQNLFNNLNRTDDSQLIPYLTLDTKDTSHFKEIEKIKNHLDKFMVFRSPWEYFRGGEQKWLIGVYEMTLMRMFENITSAISSILFELEKKVELTTEVKNYLLSDIRLLITINNIFYKMTNIENREFEIKRIDIGHDPEIPEWKPIEICLKINLDDFEERLNLKHRIMEDAFDGINEEIRKNIYIIDMI